MCHQFTQATLEIGTHAYKQFFDAVYTTLYYPPHRHTFINKTKAYQINSVKALKGS